MVLIRHGGVTMNFDIILDLITNLMLIMSLSVIYSMFDSETKSGPILSKLIMGIAVSFIGLLVMRNHVLLEDGLVFDGRSVLMLLTALYFGVIPSVIGGATLIGYRYYLTILYDSPSGLIPGILWIIVPIIIGLIWRRIRLKKTPYLARIRYLEQFFVIFMTQAITVSILFLFPKQISNESISIIAPTLLIFYPMGGFLVSIFMFRVRKNYLTQKRIKQSEIEYLQLFKSGASSNFLIDPVSHYIINANDASLDLYGYNLDEFKELKISEISLHGNQEINFLLDTDNTSNIKYYVSKHRLRSGEIIDIEIRKSSIIINDSNYIYANVIDISERILKEKKYQDVNEKLKTTLKGVNDGIIVIDEYGNVELVNDLGSKYITVDYPVGQSIKTALNIEETDNQLDFNTIIDDILKNNQNYKNKSPYILYDKNSVKHYIDFSLSLIMYNEDRNHKGAILVISDMTEKHLETNQINYISQHDHHTGLYNRYFFDEELNRLDTTRQLPISLIMGDINGLKIINDTYGHFEGDRYIKEISDILTKATRSEDIVARWGGDEFIILLPQTSEENANKVINRINDLCNKSMYDIVTPSISIGLAIKTKENQELNNVIADAEERMYTNKQSTGKLLRKEILNEIYKRINNLHPDLDLHAKTIEFEANLFGHYLNLKNEEIKTLSTYAKYHDIGWISVTKDMIDKDTNLIKQDLSFTKNHPEIGFRIMKSIPELSHLAELIEAQKERFDGTGFPNGLKGEDIPYLCRILTIVDYVDTCYTRGLIDSEIVEKLKNEANKRFDPKLVKKYIQMKKESK